MQTTRARTASALLGLSAALLGLAAARPASAQTHVYTLNNTLADANGGPSLVPDGGTLSSSGYTFGPNQGLTLSNAISATNYSIELNFSLTDLSGYRKLVDFNDKTNDDGLYLLNGSLNYFPVATGPAVITANQSLDVLLTRDGVTNLVTGSLNGVQQFSFIDTGNIATFSSAGNVIHFFEDDNATGLREASGGTVTRIAINAPPAAVPEASTTASLGLLLALGLGGLVVAAKRRKSAASGG